MADIKEAIRRLIYQYTVEGADKVMATQEAVAASTTKTDKASLSLEKSFSGLERRYVDTVRAQQDYQKVQEKVNAAVAQNPELQERANTVLAAAGQHFENLASRAEKGSITTKLLSGAIRTLIGPAGLLGIAMTGIGTAIGYMAAQWQSSSTTVEQALTETNRLIAEGKKLIDERTSAQDRMFAQSKDQTQFELLQNQVDLQRKLNSEIEQTIALAEKRAGMPSQVPGEMGEAPTGFAPSAAPGYKQIAEAMENLRNAQAAGLPGMREFNAELGRIGQEYPGVASTVQELIKAGQTATGLEQAALKARAISDALGGVATNAQMAAVGLGSIAQFNLNNLNAQEAAYNLERMANEMDRLAEKYPGINISTAKQLELLDAQLEVSKARTKEEELIAQEKLKILQLTLQGVEAEEAALLAAKERAIAEENIRKQVDQITASTRGQIDPTDRVAEAQREAAAAAAKQAPAIERAAQAEEKLGNEASQTAQVIHYQVVDMYALEQHLRNMLSLSELVDTRMRYMSTQFEGKQYTFDYDPLGVSVQKAAMEQAYGAGNIEPIYAGVGFSRGIVGYQLTQEYLQSTGTLTTAIEENTASTDTLNTTLQNTLSPYYSQDPRTTHLGFRAGVMGNPDWAAVTNPLDAILGAGATAPGMATGGSFVVGGGYSANDNQIAAFPVASGEQVVVNRNRGQASGAAVVNIDNRIIVNGSVDTDTLSQMKVSRYQQAQRMRSSLSA